MADIKVHYANFPYQEITVSFGTISIKTNPFQIAGEVVTGDKFNQLDLCTEKNVKKIGGALGWGVIGGILAGPAGIIAGSLIGGNKKEVTFIIEFKDGRKLMGTTDLNAFNQLMASKIKFDDLLSLPSENINEIDYTPSFNEEMMNKANRMYSEPDYMAWKERTGEANEIKKWMDENGYYPPGYQK